MKLELFSCSGGMAAGFRAAGITFDMVIDKNPDAIASYAANLGHKPIGIDVHDFLRMIEAGWKAHVELLVADPPCTPWSRAGKREGTADERDCLETTVAIIRALRPAEYLIANVPGLDDGPNWPVVQRLIGGLSKLGYCVGDFKRLDAARYGVPQHRVRPFWYGHLSGPCLTWPLPTHGAGAEAQAVLDGCRLEPWVTCRAALSHLPLEELGRPVRLRKRDAGLPEEPPAAPAGPAGPTADVLLMPPKGIKGQGLLALWDHPAEALSDDDLAEQVEAAKKGRPFHNPHPASEVHKPARTITGRADRGHGGGGATLKLPGVSTGGPAVHEHALDAPARTVRPRGQWNPLVLDGPARERAEDPREARPSSAADAPANTLTGAGRTHTLILRERSDGSSREMGLDAPALTVTGSRSSRERLMLDGPEEYDELLEHHPQHPTSRLDEPSKTVTTRMGSLGGGQGAAVLQLSEKHPPSDLDEPSRVIGSSRPLNGAAVLAVHERHPVSEHDDVARTITAGDGGGSKGARCLTWPWPRPATTVTTRGAIPPPGHHPEAGSILTMPDAVVLSEKAAAILQGFPDDWVFSGKTKASRWSQIGQAMPPPLAAAVATQIARRARQLVDGVVPTGLQPDKPTRRKRRRRKQPAAETPPSAPKRPRRRASPAT